MKHEDRFTIKMIYQGGNTTSLTNDGSSITAVQLLDITLGLFNTLGVSDTLALVRIYDRETGEHVLWRK